MSLTLPQSNIQYLEKGLKTALDGSRFLVYPLGNVNEEEAQSVCEQAFDTFCDNALDCESTGLVVEEIFQVVGESSFNKIEDCFADFLRRLEIATRIEPPESRMYPLGFVVFSEPQPERATVVHCNRTHEEWRVTSCQIAIDTDLALQLDALRSGEDEFENIRRGCLR